MNPYVYPPAPLHQPQQYQYQVQYTQQQPYYYVQQPSAQAQVFQAPQQYAQYGAVPNQTPQTAASVGQYPVQGYTQVAGAQQFVAANAPGQNVYAATAQVGQGHDQATAQKTRRSRVRRDHRHCRRSRLIPLPLLLLLYHLSQRLILYQRLNSRSPKLRRSIRRGTRNGSGSMPSGRLSIRTILIRSSTKSGNSR